MKNITLGTKDLGFKDLINCYYNPIKVDLDNTAVINIEKAAALVQKKIKQNETIYSINTGFGKLASVKIDENNLQELQRRILLSHATGVGEYLEDNIVRLILLIKIHSLSQGYSGITLPTLKFLIFLLNNEIYPCVPAKGSVGASGDLAPLSHLCLPIIGEGYVRYKNKKYSSNEILNKFNLDKINLQAKEGLALINGTQVSTSIAISALIKTKNIFDAAIVAGSMSIDASKGSITPFDPRIQKLRRLKGQKVVAQKYLYLLEDSEINKSHKNCSKVQDPYSLRCQPQVMGACLDQIEFVESQLMLEANSVTDNPLVFTDEGDIISGGNFHAEPVAMASDNLALAIAEIGSISERRTALLMDPNFSSLPAFLVKNSGLNSGFMMAHVTASALVSENKMLSHPASVDSIPTSSNQEDHVSMATSAANRLVTMVDNLSNIIAIELLAASQGIDFREEKTSVRLQQYLNLIREQVPEYLEDRIFFPDINKVKNLLDNRKFLIK